MFTAERWRRLTTVELGDGRKHGETLVIIYLPVNAPGGGTKRRKLRMPQRTEGRGAYHKRNLRRL